MTHRRALITGGSGFLGRHFIRRLIRDGWEALCIDLRDVPAVDARDFFRQSDVRFDLVIHCAAAIPDIESRLHNSLPVAANLALDALFFEWMMRTKPRQAVYFSSSAAYPIHLNQEGYALCEDDIDLDDLREPDGMYGLTKLVGEVQAREARRQGQHVLVVRPQSGYGEDQSLSYPFPSILDRVKRREDPLVVWGSGHQKRDFIHVDDVVSAVLSMLDADAEGPFNIGTGKPTAMMALALLASNLAGYEPRILTDSGKPEGSRHRYASTERMHVYWDHQISLEEGIERALEAP